jgi:hypothetical protein
MATAKTPVPLDNLNANEANLRMSLEGTVAIRLKAKGCKMTGPDEATVYIEWKPLSDEEMGFLKKMFPHLGDKVGELLDKELVLAALKV